MGWTRGGKGTAWKDARMEGCAATSPLDPGKPQLCSSFLQFGIPSCGSLSSPSLSQDTPEWPRRWEARLVCEPTRLNPCRPRPVSQVASVAASPGVRPSPPRPRLPPSPLLLR